MNLSERYKEQRKVINKIKAAETFAAGFAPAPGVEITAIFNGNIIGTLQSISYSSTRGNSPIVTLGESEPRSIVVSRPIEFESEWPRPPE